MFLSLKQARGSIDSRAWRSEAANTGAKGYRRPIIQGTS